MQETEIVPCLTWQRRPMGTRGLQQGKGAVDIGLDKITRAMDGTIHMAFSGKIDDGYRLILGDQGMTQALSAISPCTKAKPGSF